MEELKDNIYDSMIIFEERPICIKDEQGISNRIYGILYNKETERQNNDLFHYKVATYICYLQAVEHIQKIKDCKVINTKEWLLPDGTKLNPRSYEIRQLIYERFRNDMIKIRYVEFNEPLHLHSSETHMNCLLISPKPLERYSINTNSKCKIYEN